MYNYWIEKWKFNLFEPISQVCTITFICQTLCFNLGKKLVINSCLSFIINYYFALFLILANWLKANAYDLPNILSFKQLKLN